MSHFLLVDTVDKVALLVSKLKQQIADLEKALALAKGDYADHIVIHQFMLTATTTTPSDDITLRAATTIHNYDANIFLKKDGFKITGTAGVSHQRPFFYAGASEWTEPTHSNRFTFRLSHVMYQIPHFKIEVTMFTKEIYGHRTPIGPLMFFDDGSTAEFIDELDMAFVTYFTPTKDHIIQNDGDNAFDFGVRISIWDRKNSVHKEY